MDLSISIKQDNLIMLKYYFISLSSFINWKLVLSLAYYLNKEFGIQATLGTLTKEIKGREEEIANKAAAYRNLS